jgi:hypothetical protein
MDDSANSINHSFHEENVTVDPNETTSPIAIVDNARIVHPHISAQTAVDNTPKTLYVFFL